MSGVEPNAATVSPLGHEWGRSVKISEYLLEDDSTRSVLEDRLLVLLLDELNSGDIVVPLVP